MNEDQAPKSVRRGQVRRPGQAEKDARDRIDVPADFAHESPSEAEEEKDAAAELSFRERNRRIWRDARPKKPEWKAPEKITAQSLQEKLEARGRKSAPLSEEQKLKRRGGAAYAALGLAAVAMLGTTVLLGQQHEQNNAQNQSEIISLMGQTAQARRAPETKVEPVDLAKLDQVAHDYAQKLADAQNRFGELYAATRGGKGAQDGEPSKEEVALFEHRGSLSELFDESTFLMGEDLTNWTTGNELKPYQLDPRTQWYVKYDKASADSAAVPSKASEYRWQVRSSLPKVVLNTDDVEVVQAGPSQAIAIWECVELDQEGKPVPGKTLAWARGVFEYDIRKFSSVQVTTTSYGQQHLATGALRESEGVKIPELEDMGRSGESR